MKTDEGLAAVADCTPTAAAYARYSTDRQDARSIEDQLRRCREFATSRDWQLIAEYKDAAQSGAHLDRAEMQRLLTDAKRRGGSPFSAVLVDDLSRLSRDLGNTWRIVFEDLASLNVNVVDVSTGQASDAQGARLTFGVRALINDSFLETVRIQTHRGLEGRALGGFWTGGRVFGFATVLEPNPPDAEHPRRVVVVNEEQAVIVRRVFDLAAHGMGFTKIADTLNREGIPAPYDGVVSKKRGRGWSQSTIRAMLLNERYTGKFTWNKRRFVRSPGRRHRRAILRPPAEWKVVQHPELAIVPSDLWATVQGRFRSPAGGPRGRGRPLGASMRRVHLLSGILRCGVCGAGMGITGTRSLNRERYFTFGCTAHHTRGQSICSNSLTVSEKKVNEAIFGALRDTLMRPEVMQYFVDSFNKRLAEARRSLPSEGTSLDEEVGRVQNRIRNLTEALAHAGWSATLGQSLRDEESKLEALWAKQGASGERRERSQALPHPKLIRRYVGDLLKTIEAKPEEGRELLRQRLGSVILMPKGEGPDRAYHATGAFNLTVSLGEDDSTAPENKVAGAGFEPATFGL